MRRGAKLFAMVAIFFCALFFADSKAEAFDWGSYRLNAENNAAAFDLKYFSDGSVSSPITVDLGNPNNLTRPVAGGGR